MKLKKIFIPKIIKYIEWKPMFYYSKHNIITTLFKRNRLNPVSTRKTLHPYNSIMKNSISPPPSRRLLLQALIRNTSIRSCHSDSWLLYSTFLFAKASSWAMSLVHQLKSPFDRSREAQNLGCLKTLGFGVLPEWWPRRGDIDLFLRDSSRPAADPHR